MGVTSLAAYAYDLDKHRNIWATYGAQQFFGYSQEELHALGDQLLPEVIDLDDWHLVRLHHNTMRGLQIGESAELYCRVWGRGDLAPRFVRFVDRCVALNDAGQCYLIEGTLQEVSAQQFDAYRLIQRALIRGQLLLHYQPICSLETGLVVGYEALARWNHSGVIKGPGAFLSVIENTALELPWIQCQIGLLEAALTALPDPLWLSLNLSGSAIQTGKIPDLLALLSKPNRLQIEILESVSLGNPAVLATLQEIRVRHVLKADDVGSELSGLSRFLASQLFSGIKLDRVLVDGIPDDHDICQVAAHVIGLARDLGLSVTAEWVCNARQVDWLIRHHVDYGQGELFGLSGDLHH